MTKAKYIGCAHDGWQHTELHYEYRGHHYIVTKHNNGYMDKSLRQQHQEEQAKIDQMIEHENDPIPEWKYEGSAQEGFDLFWEFVEGERWVRSLTANHISHQPTTIKKGGLPIRQ